MATIDLTTLSKEFKGDLVTPLDPAYNSAIARWASNAARKASVVAFVKDENDVALAIKFADANALPIAIRGGGHSPSGASSIEGGLVIDLSKYLNDARIDPAKSLAYIGGGALWDVVDKNAIAHGLATVGGTVNHTGVGGLLLGGGYGWLSAQHGLVIDNLVQATLVTADGSVVTASESENPDLFFGIRGGGCNFGVATEFVLKLHPQRPTVYGGILIFTPTALERIVSATREWLPKAGEKEGMIHMTTVGPDGPMILVFVFYNGSEAEGRENFKAFLDIGPVMDTSREIPYEEMNALQNPAVNHGNGVYMKGLAQKAPDLASMEKAYEMVIERSDPNRLRMNILYEYFPLAKICSIPNDKTPFRRGPTPSILIAIAWNNAIADRTDEARAASNELRNILAGGQSDISNIEIQGYSNYDPDGTIGTIAASQAKAELVFGAHYPRLQNLKKKYDPKNIFNKWFPVAPAA